MGQQIEELVVAAACVSLGITMLVIQPDRLPAVWQRWAHSRHRRGWAIGAIVLGLAMVGVAMTGA